MTMVEPVGTETRAALVEGLSSSLGEQQVALFATVEPEGGPTAPSTLLTGLRTAFQGLLDDGVAGPAAAALLVAEALRLGAAHGVRAAATVGDRVVVAASSAPWPAPAGWPTRSPWGSASSASSATSETAPWHPGAAFDRVAVTEFGRVPGPYLARLAEGVAFGIRKRAHVVVQVHPLTDAQARAAGLHDRADRRPDVTASALMDNPSGVLAAFAGPDAGFALLTRRNVVIGCVLPQGHPLLDAQDAGVEVPESF